MIRKYLFMLLALAVILPLASCSDNEDADGTYARFAGKIEPISGIGAKVNVNVESNTAWALSKPKDGTWYHVTPSTSRDDEQLTVEIDPTTQSEGRRGVIYLSTTTLTDSIVFEQNKLQLPGASGMIKGLDTADPGTPIILTCDSLPDAQEYHWYRDTTLYATTTVPHVEVLLSGKYSVAGYNSIGEGEKSPAKEVEYSRHYTFDNVEKAEYIGGSYNLAYQVVLTKKVSETTEIGFFGTFYEEKPADLNNITLPARDYLCIQPIENDYKAPGTIAPSSEYTIVPWGNDPFTGCYFFIRKNGKIVEGSQYYLTDSRDSKITVQRNGHDYTMNSTPMQASYAKIGMSDWGSKTVLSMTDVGAYSMSFKGTINFTNNSQEYWDYAYDKNQFTGNYQNLNCERFSLSYNPKEPGTWNFNFSEESGMAGKGWSVNGTFYTASKDLTVHTGIYLVAKDVKAKEPGTLLRGYSHYGSADGLIATYWDALKKGDEVYGQPVPDSYLKIEKVSTATYRITLRMYDSSGHHLTLRYTGLLEPAEQRQIDYQ